MKELELKLMAVITETMPKDKNGKIENRLLHSDLIIAVSEALHIHGVVKSFTAEQVVNELKECDTLDDAIMFFK
jgi:hypothetical protein